MAPPIDVNVHKDHAGPIASAGHDVSFRVEDATARLRLASIGGVWQIRSRVFCNRDTVKRYAGSKVDTCHRIGSPTYTSSSGESILTGTGVRGRSETSSM